MQAMPEKLSGLVPDEVSYFIQTGGVSARVRHAIREAARWERKHCLKELERMLADLPDDADMFARAYLMGEIARLHRSISPTPDRIREQTRERVRRHRERKQQAGKRQ